MLVDLMDYKKNIHEHGQVDSATLYFFIIQGSEILQQAAANFQYMTSNANDYLYSTLTVYSHRCSFNIKNFLQEKAVEATKQKRRKEGKKI
jgi:hypothetical protein